MSGLQKSDIKVGQYIGIFHKDDEIQGRKIQENITTQEDYDYGTLQYSKEKDEYPP